MRHNPQKDPVNDAKQLKYVGNNIRMDSTHKAAITLPELATIISANPRSLRNAFYLRPQDFPSAIHLPACRGPRFLMSDVQAWLESRKTQPQPKPALLPPMTASQGRPRKASLAQITRARNGQGKGGSA